MMWHTIPVEIEFIVICKHGSINVIGGDVVGCTARFLLGSEQTGQIGTSYRERVGEIEKVHVAFDIAVAGGVRRRAIGKRLLPPQFATIQVDGVADDARSKTRPAAHCVVLCDRNSHDARGQGGGPKSSLATCEFHVDPSVLNTVPPEPPELDGYGRR